MTSSRITPSSLVCANGCSSIGYSSLHDSLVLGASGDLAKKKVRMSYPTPMTSTNRPPNLTRHSLRSSLSIARDFYQENVKS